MDIQRLLAALAADPNVSDETRAVAADILSDQQADGAAYGELLRADR